MKKSSIVLALIFASLLSYVFLVDKKKPTSTSPSGTNEKIFSFKPEEVRSFEINQNDNAILIQKKEDKFWQIEKPIDDWADSSQVDGLIQNLINLESISKFTGQEDIKSYGLDQSATHLKINLNSGASSEIRIGKESPTHQGVYASSPDKQGIFLINASLVAQLNKPLETWRDHALFHPFNTEKIDKVSLSVNEQDIVLEKKGTTWQMTSPTSALTDESKVRELLNFLSMTRFQNFVSAGEKVSFSPPSLSMSIHESDEKEPQTVVVGQEKKNRVLPSHAEDERSFGARSHPRLDSRDVSLALYKYPAKTEGRNALYSLPASVINAIHSDPSYYEDTHIFSFNEQEVTQVDILHGTQHYVFDKKGVNWVISQPPNSLLDPAKANVLISDLKALQSVKTEEAPVPLDTPQTAITLFKDKIMLTELTFGKEKTLNKQKLTTVQVEPGQKLFWANTDLLTKDLP